MTYQQNQTQNAPQTEGSEKNPPTHVGKVRVGNGRGAFYTTVGRAWENVEEGTLYFIPYGTQLIDAPVTFYPIDGQQ